MNKIRSSSYLSFLERAGTVVITLISVVILSRLLTPEEIGVYSVGMAVISISHIFRDFGVGQYLIAERDLTRNRIRAAFTVTAIFSWTIAALIFLISGVLSEFYSQPGLKKVLEIVSINFLILPFGSPAVALLRRELAFGILFFVNILSAAIREITAITLAYSGFGFSSLAWGAVAGIATTVIIVGVIRPRLTFLLPSFRELRRPLSFGANISAAAVVSEIGMNAGDLILGRMIGFAAVGYYSRALGLMNMFHQQFMTAARNVLLPVISQMSRSGEPVEPAYYRAMALVTVCAWPFYTMLFCMAEPIVMIMFGEQWLRCVPLVRFLAIAGMVGSLFSFAPQVIIALGEARSLFRCECIIQTFRVVSIICAGMISLEAVAASLSLSYLLAFLVYDRALRRRTGIRISGLFIAVRDSAVVTVFAAILPIVVMTNDIVTSNGWSLAIAMAGALAGWCLGLRLTGHPAAAEFFVVGKAILSKIGHQS